MPWPVPVVVGAAFAALGAAVVGGKRETRRRSIWQAVASELGGTYLPPEGFWKRLSPRIDVTLGAARVLLDTYEESTGQTTVTYSRCRVTLPLAAGAVFKVVRHGGAASIANFFGKEDVTLGHGGFDRHFVVRCNEHEGARLMWTERAMKLAEQHFPKATIKCDGRMVTLRQQKALRDPERIRAAIEILAELGNCDFYHRSSLQSIREGKYVEAEGPWDERSRPHVLLDLPSRVVIGPEVFDGRVAMVARLAAAVALPPKTVSFPDGDVADLPLAAKPYRSRVGTGVLAVEGGQASYRWNEPEPSSEEMRQAAEMLAVLVPATAVYR